MNEASFKQLVKRNFGGQWTAVESLVSTGFPDVVWSLTGKTKLIEFKIAHGLKVYFQPSQIAWYTSHLRHGDLRNVFIMIRHGDWIIVTQAMRALDCPDREYKKDKVVMPIKWFKDHGYSDCKAWDWDKLKEAMLI